MWSFFVVNLPLFKNLTPYFPNIFCENFQTYRKLKELYSENMYIHDLGFTINILLYLFFTHLPILLPIQQSILLSGHFKL